MLQLVLGGLRVLSESVWLSLLLVCGGSAVGEEAAREKGIALEHALWRS